MSTIQAFNTMLKTFVEELAAVFPEEKHIATFLAGFDPLVALSPRKPLELFVQAVGPHAQHVMARDPALFEHLRFPGGIDFQVLWSSDISDATRDAIWQYLHLLFLLGTTVQSMPAEMLESIETVAKNCADKVQAGQMDFSSIGSLLMNGGLGALGGGLGALSGPGDDDDDDLGSPVSAPRKQTRGKKKRAPR